jgi:sarcosine oxidase subunit beta
MSKCFVCRCEDVTLHEVERLLAQGIATVEEVKRMTGLGTGPCQGKECMALCADLCARALGALAEAPPLPFTARPPYVPTPLGLFARGLEGPLPDCAALPDPIPSDAPTAGTRNDPVGS